MHASFFPSVLLLSYREGEVYYVLGNEWGGVLPSTGVCLASPAVAANQFRVAQLMDPTAAQMAHREVLARRYRVSWRVFAKVCPRSKFTGLFMCITAQWQTLTSCKTRPTKVSFFHHTMRAGDMTAAKHSDFGLSGDVALSFYCIFLHRGCFGYVSSPSHTHTWVSALTENSCPTITFFLKSWSHRVLSVSHIRLQERLTRLSHAHLMEVKYFVFLFIEDQSWKKNWSKTETNSELIL